jgi:hypothetical protein
MLFWKLQANSLARFFFSAQQAPLDRRLLLLPKSGKIFSRQPERVVCHNHQWTSDGTLHELVGGKEQQRVAVCTQLKSDVLVADLSRPERNSNPWVEREKSTGCAALG